MIDLLPGSLWLLVALALNALLAAGRSALVNSHPAQLKQMQEAGTPGAGLAIRLASDATRLLISLRLSKALAGLVAMGLALATYVPMLDFGARVSEVGTFILVLFGVGVIIGLFDFLAENVALRNPAQWALRLAPLAAVVVGLLSTPGRLMLRLAGVIAGATGDRPHPLVTEEEIMIMVDAGEEGGVIEEEEKAMIYSIFQLGDTLAREVMVPRIDILAFSEDTSLIEATGKLLESGYSRAPAYSGSIDNVTGLLYAKDLLSAWRDGVQEKAVGDLLREAYFVPEAKKVDDLLEEMQARQVHMAIVVDEYGGTAGLVTIEDIVEEIIGEIRDEYDLAEEVRFQQLQDGAFIFSGVIDLDDVNRIVGSDLPKDTSETLGGFIYSQLGRVPVSGDTLEAGGLRLVVEQVTRRRIRKVRAQRLVEPMESELHGNRNHSART